MQDTERNRAARATDYLVDSAGDIADARAELTKKEHMIKVVKAMAMRQSGEKSSAAQETEALASPAYINAINELVAAEQRYQELRALREAASARIEYWRSLNANQRAAERGYGSAT